MEEWIKSFVIHTSLVIEGAAAVVVAFAALQALILSILSFFRELGPLEIRLGLGRWLALALEFLVAADILSTAVAPTWDEIGKLAAIVLLRTALNFFLEREIQAGREDKADERNPDRQLAHRHL